MVRMPKQMMPHGGLVRFEPFLGVTGAGEQFGAAVTPRRAAIQSGTKIVKNAAGQEVMASGGVWFDPEYLPPEGSRITVWLGGPAERETRVVAVEYHEHGGALPAHVQVWVG